MSLTPEQKALHAQFDADHPRSTCWGCRSDGKRQETFGRTHHIVGRGKDCECRENYARLCGHHHHLIHSATSVSLVVCMALKQRYDGDHYDLAKMLRIKGVGPLAVTQGEVDAIAAMLGTGWTVADTIESLIPGEPRA